MDHTYDVIIAGGGPVGLFLACELGLRGTSVLVLERELHAESAWKSGSLSWRGVNTLTIENLYRRGLLDKVFGVGMRSPSFQKTEGFQFGGHFGGMLLNSNKLELERWPYKLNGPALVPGPVSVQHLETVLGEQATSLGVTILRGHGVSKVEQDDHSVTVEVGEGDIFRGKWLVGCDGGRSFVRKAAYFDFVGTEANFTGYALDCDLSPPNALKPGYHMAKGGMYITGKGGSLYLADFDGGKFDRRQEITTEIAQEVLNRILGHDEIKITAIRISSTFTDRSKQATSYRNGRVLLAGDAAHIHGPLGSQGLNLGVGDAMNLGWKLASTVAQEMESDKKSVDLTLLDTYEKERHPIAAWVLEWTRAQVMTMKPDEYGASIRKLVGEFIDTIDGTNQFISKFWGLEQRYSLGDDACLDHSLIGSSVPDFELQGNSRLGSKLIQGRGMLIELTGAATLGESLTTKDYEGQVDYLNTTVKNSCGLKALLIRPDGIVAWVVEEGTEPDMDTLQTALKRWFGQ